MSRIFKLLNPLVRAIIRHPVVTILLAAAATIVGLVLALDLRIDTDISRLLPHSYPSVQALDRLRDTVGSESAIAVIIESPSFDANVAFADTLIPEALRLTDAGTGEPLLVRVEYRKDTHFLENNALYFATDDELRQLELYLIRQRARANSPLPFNTRSRSSQDLPMELVEAYESIIPPEYPVSPDSMTMVVRFYANGRQTNLGFVDKLYTVLDSLVLYLQPKSFHAGMEVSVAGRFERNLVEVRAIRRDVIGSFGGGVTTVLLVVLLYFALKTYKAQVPRGWSWPFIWAEVKRLPITSVLIGLPLTMSLAWTFGYASVAFESLNLMTSTLVLVLFGLGVDYGIHFYARYLEDRTVGFSMENAIEATFTQVGPAIVVSALTTAAALFVLILADFQGFSQFGVIAGVGVLLAMLAMLTVLPALIVLCEHGGLLPHGIDGAEEIDPSQNHKALFPASRWIVIGTTVVTVFLLLFAPFVQFEYRFGNLEPVFPEYEANRAKEGRVYPSGRRNPAYLVVDRREDIPEVTRILRERAAADTVTPTIMTIESLQERYPLDKALQQERLRRLARVRRLLEDPFLRALGTTRVERLRRASRTTVPVPLDSVPDFLKKQFTSRTGELGNYVIVYPSVGLSDGQRSIEFAEDVGQVELPDGRTYTAASTSIVAADMLRLLLEESPWMVFLTSLVLLTILLFMFRSWKWTLLAASPLFLGVVWMMGLLVITGTRLSFYNLVVLPAMLGIGIDGGVHILHRYLADGPGSLRRILFTTGEHVALGSITTLIAFAWWLFSHHPGLNSIGVLALLGIGSVLVASLVCLPAILQQMENRAGRNTVPEGGPESPLS